MTIQAQRQGGFTLVELILAMALFSFFLLIVVAGFLHVVKLYQLGLVARDTQQNTRFGMQEMVRAAREGERVGIGTLGNQVCLYYPGGGVKFYIETTTLRRQQLSENSSCDTSPNASDPAVSSTDVKVIGLAATPVQEPAAPGITPTPSVELTLTIASTNDPTLITGQYCQQGNGSQFCSVTVITSAASLRGGSR